MKGYKIALAVGLLLLPGVSMASSQLVAHYTGTGVLNSQTSINNSPVSVYNFVNTGSPITHIVISHVKQISEVTSADNNLEFHLTVGGSPIDCHSITQLRSAWGIPVSSASNNASTSAIDSLVVSMSGTQCQRSSADFTLQLTGDSSAMRSQYDSGSDTTYTFSIYSGGLPVAQDGIVSLTAPTGTVSTSTIPVHFTGTFNNGINITYEYLASTIYNGTYSTSMKPVALDISTLGTGQNIAFDIPTKLPLQGYYTYSSYLIDIETGTTTPAMYGSFTYGITATTTSLLAPPDIVCALWDITCYFKGALIWLVYPTESLTTSFDGFIATIQTKPPVGYFNILKNNLNGLNASSTPVVNVTIPSHIKSVIFTPFDIAIGSILWFFFAINFYKRLKHIQI